MELILRGNRKRCGGGREVQIYNVNFGKQQEVQKDVRLGEEMKVVGREFEKVYVELCLFLMWLDMGYVLSVKGIRMRGELRKGM